MKYYISISNAEGKTWVLPQKNISTALEIYQPASWKGKLVKKALPIMTFCGIIPINHSLVGINQFVSNRIKTSIKDCFGNDVEFSFFGGTPGTHMKPTVQVFRGNDILGYAKYSNNPNIISLFRNEMEMLNYLNTLKVSNIPRCLKCDDIGQGETIFIQNTEKKVGSKTLHHYSTIHKDFLNELRKKTVASVSFEETDYYKMLRELKKLMVVLSRNDQKIVQNLINNSIKHYSSRNERYSVCHRDFTPWNTCIVENRLFVFDWEYSKKLYPFGMDKARFLVEIAHREKHKKPQEIVNSLCANKRALIDYGLDNLYIFLLRGQDNDKDNISFNIALLKCLAQ